MDKRTCFGMQPILLLWIIAKILQVSYPLSMDSQCIYVKDKLYNSTSVVLGKPSIMLCTNTSFMTQLGYLKNSYPLSNPIYASRQSSFFSLMVLIIAGDIELNPGPGGDWPAPAEWALLYPCGCCELKVDWSDLAVCCDACNMWHHKSCISMYSSEYEHIENVS